MQADSIRTQLSDRAPHTAAVAARYEAAVVADARWQDLARRSATDRHTARLAGEVLAGRTATPPRGSLADQIATERRRPDSRPCGSSTAAPAAEQERTWREEQDRVLRPQGPTLDIDRA